MQKFLINIASGILFFCIVSYPLDIWLSHKILDYKHFAVGESHIWSEIIDGNMNKDVLIYGSSRAMTNFNTKIISDSLGLDTYSLGIDGHNFWLQYLRHRKVLDNNIKPKYIVLSVGPFAIGKRSDLYNSFQFLPFSRDLEMNTYLRGYNGYNFYVHNLPLLRFCGKKDTLIRNIKYNIRHTRYKGFLTRNQKWNNDLYKAKSKFESIKSKIHYPSLKLLHQFIQECKSSNIELIFVYSPEEIKGRDYVSNRSDIINLFRDITNEYNLPFLDYSDGLISTNRENFYNTLHLNKTGAERFSLQLVEDLKKIL
ncbi:hypothetical protein [Winogradskyella sp. A3E31]|uniref:hypothetical protein n=1 Tax=Winogradskyella sp. A3E31 TaxID=3349637 RepID=UPI00398B2ED7